MITLIDGQSTTATAEARARNIARERTRVMQSTRDWWRYAHNSNNLHHQRFPGYCIWCRKED